MKKAIILVVLLLVLGGGGYVGWQQMGGASPEGEAGEGGDSPSIFSEEPKYVELDLLTAPFVRSGKFVQYVVIVVILEVDDDEGVSKVRAVIPRLRDAFVTELHTIATMRNPEQQMLNLTRIKSRLLASAHEVMRNKIVRDILVQLAQ